MLFGHLFYREKMRQNQIICLVCECTFFFSHSKKVYCQSGVCVFYFLFLRCLLSFRLCSHLWLHCAIWHNATTNGLFLQNRTLFVVSQKVNYSCNMLTSPYRTTSQTMKYFVDRHTKKSQNLCVFHVDFDADFANGIGLGIQHMAFLEQHKDDLDVKIQSMCSFWCGFFSGRCFFFILFFYFFQFLSTYLGLYLQYVDWSLKNILETDHIRYK